MSNPSVHIAAISPLGTEARRLITALDAHQAALYPSESNHFDSPETLATTDVFFLGAYADNELMGIGAVKSMDNRQYGEIKRLYVAPNARGLGIARSLLSQLESAAAEQGMPLVRLETGIHQPEAIGLYERMGYVEIGPFGDYPADPLSRFFEKRLV